VAPTVDAVLQGLAAEYVTADIERRREWSGGNAAIQGLQVGWQRDAGSSGRAVGLEAEVVERFG